MYIAQINPCDTQNGADTREGATGFRTSIFVSGCTLGCEDCFNKEAWNFRYGKQYDHVMDEYIKQCVGKPYIEGLSVLGGDPLERKNVPEVYNLCKDIKRMYPDKTIWLWSGRTLEEIQDDPIACYILDVIDTLVDGRYVKKLKDEKLLWRGSSNQRIIFLKQLKPNR